MGLNPTPILVYFDVPHCPMIITVLLEVGGGFLGLLESVFADTDHTASLILSLLFIV